MKNARTVREFIDLAVGVYGPIEMQNGDVYTGPLANGEREGYGLIVFADQSFYIGNWQRDMANGIGKHVSIENTVSEGEWKDNTLCGFARVI
jgi:hypothetical protein